MTSSAIPQRDVGLQGHYAGIATRFAAFVIDVVVVATTFAVGGRVFEFVITALRGDRFSLSDAPRFSTVAFIVWALVYCTYPVAVSGRTVGLAAAGLRVVRRDGTDVEGRHALVRVVALPLSFLAFGLGFLLILVNRESRALHDLIAGTAVVYDWDARAARLRLLSKQRIA
jgi:uncharacterized RDD family membrane protein YckC